MYVCYGTRVPYVSCYIHVHVYYAYMHVHVHCIYPPLQVFWQDGLLLLLPEHKEFVQSGCVEQFVVGHPVDLHLTRVVVVQQSRSRRLPAQLQQVVDLLYGLEGFLGGERYTVYIAQSGRKL